MLYFLACSAVLAHWHSCMRRRRISDMSASPSPVVSDKACMKVPALLVGRSVLEQPRAKALAKAAGARDDERPLLGAERREHGAHVLVAVRGRRVFCRVFQTNLQVYSHFLFPEPPRALAWSPHHAKRERPVAPSPPHLPPFPFASSPRDRPRHTAEVGRNGATVHPSTPAVPG